MTDEAQPDWTAEGEAIEAKLHRIRHQLLNLLTERVNPWAAAHAAECRTTHDQSAVHDRYRYYDVTGALEGIGELLAEDEDAEGLPRTVFGRGF